MKKDFIRLSGTLCLITLVAAMLLAGVNSITADKIEKASQAKSEESMKKLLSNADSFEPLSDDVFEGKKNGETVGFCVKEVTDGFGGEIEMMVGFSTDGTVKGIDVLSHSETAGLGAKSDTPEFEGRFKGKEFELDVVKTPTDASNEVQAITGATITSRAVASGVLEAAEKIIELQGGNN